MTDFDLKPGEPQPDPSHDIRNRPLPEVKGVDPSPLEPRPIDDDTIKKGEEQQIDDAKRQAELWQLIHHHLAITTPGDALKYGIGLSLGAIAMKLIGC